MCATSQPPIVAFVLEEFAIDQAPHFVDAVAEDEAAVEDGDGRPIRRQELAVEEDCHSIKILAAVIPSDAGDLQVTSLQILKSGPSG